MGRRQVRVVSHLCEALVQEGHDAELSLRVATFRDICTELVACTKVAIRLNDAIQDPRAPLHDHARYNYTVVHIF